MADTQINAGGGDSSASTVLMAVVIILLIGLAIWFFGFRGAAPAADNVTDINVTVPAGSGIPAGPAE